MPRYKLRENYPRLVSMENKTYVSLLESGVPGDMLTLVENAFRIIFEDAAPAPAVDTFYTDMADALGIDLSAARMDDGSLNKKKVKSLIGQDERYQNAMMAAADVMNAAEAKSGLKDEKGYLYGDMQQSKGYLGFIAKFKQALALSFVRDGVPAPGVKDLISRRIADGLQSRLKSDQGISTPETRSHTYDLMSAGTFKPSSIGWNLIDSDIFASYPYGKNDSILVRKLAGADAIRSLILEMRVTDAIMKMDALRNDDGVEGYSFYKKRDDEEKLLVLVRGGTVLGTASSDSDFYAPYITTALARFFLSDAVTGCAPGQSFITDERTSNALNNELEDVKVAVELSRKSISLYKAAIGVVGEAVGQSSVCIVPVLTAAYDEGYIDAEEVEYCFNHFDDELELPPAVELIARRIYPRFSVSTRFSKFKYGFTGKSLAMTVSGEEGDTPEGGIKRAEMETPEWQLDILRTEGLNEMLRQMSADNSAMGSKHQVSDEVMQRVCSGGTSTLRGILEILQYYQGMLSGFGSFGRYDAKVLRVISDKLSKYVHPGVQRRLLGASDHDVAARSSYLLKLLSAQLPNFKVDRRAFDYQEGDGDGFTETFGITLPVKNVRKALQAGRLFEDNVLAEKGYDILSSEGMCAKFSDNPREKALAMENMRRAPIGPVCPSVERGTDTQRFYTYCREWILPFIEKYGDLVNGEAGETLMFNEAIFRRVSMFSILGYAEMFDAEPELARAVFLGDGGVFWHLAHPAGSKFPGLRLCSFLADDVLRYVSADGMKGIAELLVLVSGNDISGFFSKVIGAVSTASTEFQAITVAADVFSVDTQLRTGTGRRESWIPDGAYAELASNGPGIALALFGHLDNLQREAMSRVISAPEVIRRILYKNGSETQVDRDGIKLLLSLAGSTGWSGFTNEFVRANESVIRQVISTMEPELREGAIQRLGLNSSMKASSGSVGNVRFTVVNGLLWMSGAVSGGTKSPVNPGISMFPAEGVEAVLNSAEYSRWRLPTSSEVKLLNNTPYVGTIGFPVTGALSTDGNELTYDKFYGWCTKDNGSTVPYIVDGDEVRIGNKFNLPTDMSQMMCAIKLVQAE